MQFLNENWFFLGLLLILLRISLTLQGMYRIKRNEEIRKSGAVFNFISGKTS